MPAWAGTPRYGNGRPLPKSFGYRWCPLPTPLDSRLRGNDDWRDSWDSGQLSQQRLAIFVPMTNRLFESDSVEDIDRPKCVLLGSRMRINTSRNIPVTSAARGPTEFRQVILDEWAGATRLEITTLVSQTWRSRNPRHLVLDRRTRRAEIA